MTSLPARQGGVSLEAGNDARAARFSSLRFLIRQYPGNNYVITSRPQGYRSATIESAGVLQVRGFTTEQVSRFVHGWYLAVERHSTGAVGEDITIRARGEADDLLQRLDHAPALYDLTVNPLLHTMIANMHRYRGASPGSRPEQSLSGYSPPSAIAVLWTD